MNRISISVVTCTYNSADYIRDNIESVWSYNPPDEQVIVDGFSTDNTVKIISQYKKKGYNIKVVEREPAGISDAMNVGFQHATGDVVQVLQSDDYVSDKNLYPKVRKIFENNSYQWIYGVSKVINEIGELINFHPSKMVLKYHYYLLPFINIVPHSPLFIKRKLFFENGLFDTRFKAEMDWDYWLRIGRKHIPLVVNEEWTIVRLYGDTMTMQTYNSPQQSKEIKLMLRKNFPHWLAILFYWVNRFVASIKYLYYRKRRYPKRDKKISENKTMSLSDAKIQ